MKDFRFLHSPWVRLMSLISYILAMFALLGLGGLIILAVVEDTFEYIGLTPLPLLLSFLFLWLGSYFKKLADPYEVCIRIGRLDVWLSKPMYTEKYYLARIFYIRVAPEKVRRLPRVQRDFETHFRDKLVTVYAEINDMMRLAYEHYSPDQWIADWDFYLEVPEGLGSYIIVHFNDLTDVEPSPEHRLDFTGR